MQYKDANDRISRGVRLRERDAKKLMKKHSDVTQVEATKAKSADLEKMSKKIVELETTLRNLKKEHIELLGALSALFDRVVALELEVRDG